MRANQFRVSLAPRSRRRPTWSRRGIITALAAICLPVLLAFVALAVDTGRISLATVNMQNAVDAAALAASQEITAAVETAGQQGEDGDPTIDANSIAVTNARQMAHDVADRNGVYVDPDQDVVFGKRTCVDDETGAWEIQWNEAPYNVVQVTARRNGSDTSAPDGRLPLLFGWAVGKPSVELSAKAAAFVEARDLALVLDFSGSMSYDSQLRPGTIEKLGIDDLKANMEDIYTALGPPNDGSMVFEPQYLTLVGAAPTSGCDSQITVTFKANSVYCQSTKDLSNVVLGFSNGTTYKYDNLTCGPTGEFADPYPNDSVEITKAWVKSGCNESGEGPGYGERFDDTNTAVKDFFGLSSIAYPYPSGSWSNFLDHCRTDSDVKAAGYKKKYGGLVWVDYLLEKKRLHSETPALWQTPHYPFHAIKEGATLFLDFLTDLDFGDEVGLVSYATTARWETQLNEDGYNIDLSTNPITNEYADINTIQRHKQAAHYTPMTNIGDGLLKAREMLFGTTDPETGEVLTPGHIRYGARPTILLMTDGQSNQTPSGWALPADWDWADYTDYDGDGTADYVPSDTAKKYALYQAVQAVNAGATIHTMAVGLEADNDVMEAIAFIGHGICIQVAGDATIAEMQEDLLEAFSQIASKVPPAKLVYDVPASE